MSQRLLLLFTLIALWIQSSPAALGQSAQIPWRSDFAAARHEAIQSGRNLLVHFWAPWCAPCRRLETVVFNQPEIVSAMQQGFIPVKLNADEAPQIAHMYGVEQLPTDVVLRPDGAVLAKFTSPQHPATYLAQLSSFSGPNPRPSGTAQQQFAAAPAVPIGGGGHQSPQSAYAHLAQSGILPQNGQFTHGYIQQRPDQPAPAIVNGYGAGGYDRMATAADYRPFPGQEPAVQAGPPNRSYNPGGPDTGESPRAPDMYGSRYGAHQPSHPMNAGGTGVSVGAPASPASMAAAPGLGSPSAAERYPLQAAGFDERGAITNPHVASSPAPAVPAGPVRGASPVASNSNPSQPALEGFCPVTLKKEQRWLAGDKRFGIYHRGCLYFFAGPQEQQEFWSNPDAYSPVLSGLDPVLALDNGASIQGHREHGVEYGGLVYLFSSESTLQHFSRNPERYATGVRQAMRGDSGTAAGTVRR